MLTNTIITAHPREGTPKRPPFFQTQERRAMIAQAMNLSFMLFLGTGGEESESLQVHAIIFPPFETQKALRKPFNSLNTLNTKTLILPIRWVGA
jgi:hypothetical protein